MPHIFATHKRLLRPLGDEIPPIFGDAGSRSAVQKLVLLK